MYKSVVASAILTAAACWDSRMKFANDRLRKLIRMATDIVYGTGLTKVSEVNVVQEQNNIEQFLSSIP